MRDDHRCARNDRCTYRCTYREKIDPPRVCDECECHGHGPGYPCSVEGGCGHLHPTEKLTVGARIEAAAGLCVSCHRHVEQAIRELPMDYVELSTLLGGRGGNPAADVVLSSRDLPIPIRVSVHDLQSAICHEASSWAEPVAEQLGVEWDTQRARDSRPGVTLQRAARMLTNAVETLLALPVQTYHDHTSADWVDRDGIDGALELLRLHDLVRLAAGRTALVHQLPAPCPSCNTLALVRHNGADHVECEHCRDLWTETDYRRLCLVLANDYAAA
jgi:hypothetical protein